MKIAALFMTVLLSLSFAGGWTSNGFVATQEIADKPLEKSAGTNASPDEKKSKKDKKAKPAGGTETNKAAPAAESR